MIEFEVKAIGTICSMAKLRNNKTTGESFITFDIRVLLTGEKNDRFNLIISVSRPGKEEDLANYPEGKRLCVTGMMTLRKVNKTVYYNMRKVNCEQTIEEDSITGRITMFKGTIDNTINQKKDKNGKTYYVFDAYSTSKNEEGEYSYIWQKFILFESAPYWLEAGKGIEATGDVNISSYKGKPQILCRISGLRPGTRKTAK